MSIANYQADPKGTGGRIRAAREKRGEMPAKAASVVGISEFVLGKIERGDYRQLPYDVAVAVEKLMTRYGLGAAAPPAAEPADGDRAHVEHQAEYLSAIPTLAAKLDELTRRFDAFEKRLPKEVTPRPPQKRAGRGR